MFSTWALSYIFYVIVVALRSPAPSVLPVVSRDHSFGSSACSRWFVRSTSTGHRLSRPFFYIPVSREGVDTAPVVTGTTVGFLFRFLSFGDSVGFSFSGVFFVSFPLVHGFGVGNGTRQFRCFKFCFYTIATQENTGNCVFCFSFVTSLQDRTLRNTVNGSHLLGPYFGDHFRLVLHQVWDVTLVLVFGVGVHFGVYYIGLNRQGRGQGGRGRQGRGFVGSTRATTEQGGQWGEDRRRNYARKGNPTLCRVRCALPFTTVGVPVRVVIIAIRDAEVAFVVGGTSTGTFGARRASLSPGASRARTREIGGDHRGVAYGVNNGGEATATTVPTAPALLQVERRCT